MNEKRSENNKSSGITRLFPAGAGADVSKGDFVPKREYDELAVMYDTVVTHATSLENDLEEKLQEITRLSNTDAVTGVYNRRKFNECLAEEMASAVKKGRPLALIIFDIDNFKEINDTRGHDYGDHVIIRTAKLAKSCITERDVFARWGGDEFAVIIPSAGVEMGVKAAREMQERILGYYSGQAAVTCSFGVTALADGDDMNSFLIRADSALYEAKTAGRNCVKSKTA
jgi:diguanylate cyclase (GGDEF)-like protein